MSLVPQSWLDLGDSKRQQQYILRRAGCWKQSDSSWKTGKTKERYVAGMSVCLKDSGNISPLVLNIPKVQEISNDYWNLLQIPSSLWWTPLLPIRCVVKNTVTFVLTFFDSWQCFKLLHPVI